MSDLRVALVGYGLAGRSFHAPLIASTDGFELTAVVTANPARRQQLAVDHPGVQAISDAEALWEEAEPDLVIVATPNDSHAAIGAAAVRHGIPVVVDKRWR